MAQLVEHIVHIDGVTGSSPVATTIQGLSEPFLPKEWVRIFSYLGRTGVGRIEGRHGWFCPCRFLFPYPLSPDSFPVPHRMLRKSQPNIRIIINNSQSFGWDYFFIRRNFTWQRVCFLLTLYTLSLKNQVRQVDLCGDKRQKQYHRTNQNTEYNLNILVLPVAGGVLFLYTHEGVAQT